jgi:hypothetical protein
MHRNQQKSGMQRMLKLGTGDQFDEALADFALPMPDRTSAIVRRWCARPGKAVSKCALRARDLAGDKRNRELTQMNFDSKY